MNSIITDETILDITYSPVVKLSLRGPREAVIEGTYLTLECNVTANPDSYMVIWKKDGNQIQISRFSYEEQGWNVTVPYYRYTDWLIEKDDRMIYVKAIKQNEGSYVCEVINSVGSGSSNDVNLKLQFVRRSCSPENILKVSDCFNVYRA